MLEWEVNFIVKKDRQHFLLSEMEEDANISVTSEICSMEMREVETLINAAHQDDGRLRQVLPYSPREVEQVTK